MGKKGKGKKLLGKISKGVNDLLRKGEDLVNGSDSDDDQPETQVNTADTASTAVHAQNSEDIATGGVQQTESIPEPQVPAQQEDSGNSEAVSIEHGEPTADLVAVTENVAPDVNAESFVEPSVPESSVEVQETATVTEEVKEQIAEAVDIVPDATESAVVSATDDTAAAPASVPEFAVEPEVAVDSVADQVVATDEQRPDVSATVSEPTSLPEDQPREEQQTLPETRDEQGQDLDENQGQTKDEQATSETVVSETVPSSSDKDVEQPLKQQPSEEPNVLVEHPDNSAKRKGFFSYFCW